MGVDRDRNVSVSRMARRCATRLGPLDWGVLRRCAHTCRRHGPVAMISLENAPSLLPGNHCCYSVVSRVPCYRHRQILDPWRDLAGGLIVVLRAHVEVSARDRWTPLFLAVVQHRACMSALIVPTEPVDSRVAESHRCGQRARFCFSRCEAASESKYDKTNVSQGQSECLTTTVSGTEEGLKGKVVTPYCTAIWELSN